MTQRDRIATGLLFTDMTEALPEARPRGNEYADDFNHTRPGAVTTRTELARKLCGRIGEGFWIEPPIHIAYGSHVFIGANFYANFNLTLSDDTNIVIGDNVLSAANVTISTTGHPIDPVLRATGKMVAFPVTLENGVWLGSGVIINPGVTIGQNSVIGAGSVVTKSIPADVVAVGNPCRVLRPIGLRELHTGIYFSVTVPTGHASRLSCVEVSYETRNIFRRAGPSISAISH